MRHSSNLLLLHQLQTYIHKNTDSIGFNEWNDLFSPMVHDVEDKTLYYNQDGDFEAQVQIGS